MNDHQDIRKQLDEAKVLLEAARDSLKERQLGISALELRQDVIDPLKDYIRDRNFAIAVLIDALHHDYANHMQMEVDGS
jgi:hypothetical protein